MKEWVAWNREWGAKVPKLREIELATGVTPPALANAPQLEGLAVEFQFAYNVLASRRTAGFTPNPIQLSEIMAYVQIFGRPSLPIDMFVEILGSMDIKYLELCHGDKPTS